jgi:hypothetical protein
MKRREFRMRRKNLVRAGWAIGCLVAALIYIAACALSWIVTCGVFKLVTLCFGWEFTWGIATGIWLIMFLFKHVFSMGDIRTRE